MHMNCWSSLHLPLLGEGADKKIEMSGSGSG